MAHPARRARAESLVHALSELDAVLALDPDPGGPPTSLRSAAVAWARAPEWATHHLVLEDDVRVVPDFSRRLAALVAARPDAAIALFANWSSWTGAMVRAAAIGGYRWASVIDDYLPTQALVLPQRAARALAMALHTQQPKAEPGDVVILEHLRSTAIETVVAVPNLVEHEEVPSLMGNESHGQRRSCCLAGADDAPLRHDFPPLRLPAVPYLSQSRRRATLVTTARQEPRRRLLVVDAFAHRGVEAGWLRSAHDRAVRASGLTGSAAGPVLELWLTGAALGAVLRDTAAAEQVERHLAGAAARSALSTVAPGAFGTDEPSLTAAGRELKVTDLMIKAVRWGLRDLPPGAVLDAFPPDYHKVRNDDVRQPH